jgi:hypothetical protein
MQQRTKTSNKSRAAVLLFFAIGDCMQLAAIVLVPVTMPTSKPKQERFFVR